MNNILGERYVGIGPRIGHRRVLTEGQKQRKEISQIVATGNHVRRAYDAANCQPPISSLQGTPGMAVAGHIARSVLEIEGADPRAIAIAASFMEDHESYCVKIEIKAEE